jgi:hypothetical protein
MTTVVESSTDQVEAALNHGVFPVPPEVAADNAAREKKDAPKTEVKAEAKEEPKAEPKKDDADDIEGEDGLTPRQKREYTAQMLKTIGKNFAKRREAEDLAASNYNEKMLAEQRAERAERELADLKGKAVEESVELKEPVRADFKDDQSYWDAMVDYRVDRKMAAERAAAAKQEEAQSQEQMIETARSKVAAAIELVPDFEEVTAEVSTETPKWILDAMQSSDLFPELWYHLAGHPEVLGKLVGMTKGYRPGSIQFARAAQRQLVELGKIESTLQPFAKAKVKNGEEPSHRNGKPEKAEPSQETGSAPSKSRVTAPIIRPLDGGSAPQVAKDETDMNGSEVITAWQRKHGVSLTARKRH